VLAVGKTYSALTLGMPCGPLSLGWHELAMVLLAGALVWACASGLRTRVVAGVLLSLTVLDAVTLPARYCHRAEDPAYVVRERAELARAVAATTGWDYDRLRERLYIVGLEP